jgi:hypothetical protein
LTETAHGPVTGAGLPALGAGRVGRMSHAAANPASQKTLALPYARGVKPSCQAFIASAPARG